MAKVYWAHIKVTHGGKRKSVTLTSPNKGELDKVLRNNKKCKDLNQKIECRGSYGGVSWNWK